MVMVAVVQTGSRIRRSACGTILSTVSALAGMAGACARARASAAPIAVLRRTRRGGRRMATSLKRWDRIGVQVSAASPALSGLLDRIERPDRPRQLPVGKAAVIPGGEAAGVDIEEARGDAAENGLVAMHAFQSQDRLRLRLLPGDA